MKTNLLFLLLFFYLLWSCKENEPSQTSIKQGLLMANTWKGDKFTTSISIEPAIVIILAGINPEILDFEGSLLELSVTFKNDGTFSGTGLSGEAVAGTWQFLEDATKIELKGFNLEISEEMLPPELLELLPNGTPLDLLLPDIYDVIKLDSDKFHLQTSETRDVIIPNGSTNISIQIKPTVTIYLNK